MSAKRLPIVVFTGALLAACTAGVLAQEPERRTPPTPPAAADASVPRPPPTVVEPTCR